MHRPFLKPLELTFPQYLVMLELLDTAPQTVGELGTKLGMDTGTIPPLLKRLERANLVTRRRDLKDERRVLVKPTATGEILREAIRAVPGQIITACDITEKKAEELRQALDGVGLALEH
jgi:DNA-binding MarR family transcriptional regulator